MYGKTFESSANGIKFIPGVNNGVTLKEFKCHNISTSKYSGPALDIVWEKDGSTISVRRFPIDESRVTILNVYENNIKREETMEEAVTRTYAEFNTYVKHIVCNYCNENEFDNLVATANSFTDFCHKASSLMGAYQTVKGNLAVGYDSSGYLAVPQFLWQSKSNRFWSVEDDNLGVNTKYLSLEKTSVNTEVEEDTDESW